MRLSNIEPDNTLSTILIWISAVATMTQGRAQQPIPKPQNNDTASNGDDDEARQRIVRYYFK